MKKIFKIIGIGFLVLMGITLFSNIMNSDYFYVIPDRNQSRVATPVPRKVTALQVAEMIGDSCKQVWGEDFSIEWNQQTNVFRVDTWRSDLGDDVIERTKAGSNIDHWNNMVKDLKSTASTMQNSFNEFGYDDITVVLNLCDPVNHDTVYLSIAQGIAGYDVVNGVDLLNNPEG